MHVLKPTDEFPYGFRMRSIDGEFPKRDMREDMRRWLMTNVGSGFKMRWNDTTANLTVFLREVDSALFFKLRYSLDIGEELRHTD
jgi:hypothetical protein